MRTFQLKVCTGQKQFLISTQLAALLSVVSATSTDAELTAQIIAASMNMNMLAAWGNHLAAFTLLSRGTNGFAHRPPRSTSIRGTVSRRTWFDRSLLAFLAWLWNKVLVSAACGIIVIRKPDYYVKVSDTCRVR
ncbi:hypothetical protein CSKR_111876 [Clonorchis sinensis]|uniref:Uncharacterized protein n=1 Tax=Clonorchis sinensis TaxID=79923 RepID=A0A419PV31_CLOSI|nr:hypothetical protein CSKR_111876 [Clonorchis sinensis]